MRFSVCVPMYNEADAVENCAYTLSAYMTEKYGEGNFEIIFCDDGSTDGCGDKARALGLPCVRVTGYEKNKGKGFAVRTAMLESKGDFALFTDTDLAYGTDAIGRFFDAFCEDDAPEILIGSRNLNKDGFGGYTPFRKFASKVYMGILKRAAGIGVSDSQCGCKAFKREVIPALFEPLSTKGFAFDLEIIMRAEQKGFRIGEIPVRILKHGESKVHAFRDAFAMLSDVREIRKKIGGKIR